MKQLKQNSIHVADILTVCWPQYGEGGASIDMSIIKAKYNNTYCINKSTICFIVDGEVYITPYTRMAIVTIQNAGLDEQSFYVPLSNGDLPKNEKEKWAHLCDLAHKAACLDYEDDCTQWCNRRSIGSLHEKALNRCLKIPHDGVRISGESSSSVFYPICNEEKIDFSVLSKLGSYNADDDKVVFIYRDGHTYVAKGDWIVHELNAAGFKADEDLPIPLKKGEKIADPYLAKKWERAS